MKYNAYRPHGSLDGLLLVIYAKLNTKTTVLNCHLIGEAYVAKPTSCFLDMAIGDCCGGSDSKSSFFHYHTHRKRVHGPGAVDQTR